MASASPDSRTLTRASIVGFQRPPTPQRGDTQTLPSGLMRAVPRSPKDLKMINQENQLSGGRPKCLSACYRGQVGRVSRPDHVASCKNELNSSTLELGPSHCRESMRRLRVSLTIKGNRAIPITLPKKRLDISVVTPYFWLRFLL